MRAPDMEGPAGRAWCVPWDATEPGAATTVSLWLINRPGAHPFWEWWMISVVHLRDAPPLPPAHKRYPEAEHEFVIMAIDPEECPNPDPDSAGYPPLMPPDVCTQFHGIGARDCERLCAAAASIIVKGQISPDSDYRRFWVQLVQDTVNHFRTGMHPEN